MLSVNTNQFPAVADKIKSFTSLPVAMEVQPDSELNELLIALSPDTPWGDRQIAANKIGYLRNPEALPWLLAALPVDPFWMVRCAIIQALEMIDDPGAIPALEEIATNDGFQVVRKYAAKVVEVLSQ
jgi:HEAT repeat protein